jgi:hypothetical protein
MDNNDIFGLDQLEIENTTIDDIGGDSVTLIFLGIDQSISMANFKNEMAKQLSEFKNSLITSKDVDEIIIARANFWQNIVDISGYKKVDQLDIRYTVNGATPLYDTIVEGTEKLLNYMNFLKTNGMRVKAVFSIFSDGEDTTSSSNMKDARAAVDTLNRLEIITAYIAFGNEGVPEAKRLEFKNILQVGRSSQELRKAFGCLSKSVSATSQKAVIDNLDDFFNV